MGKGVRLSKEGTVWGSKWKRELNEEL